MYSVLNVDTVKVMYLFRVLQRIARVLQARSLSFGTSLR
jgi:hypothetical protein